MYFLNAEIFFQTMLYPTKAKKKIQVLLNIKNSPFSTSSLIYWSTRIVSQTCNKTKIAILNFDVFVVPDSVRLSVPCIVCNIRALIFILHNNEVQHYKFFTFIFFMTVIFVTYNHTFTML